MRPPSPARCLLACLATLALGGCGAGSPSGGVDTTTCAPSATAECTCPGGADGERTCLSDGSAYGPCFCSGGAGGSGATGGAACVPDEVASCYGGPAGTDGVGPCKAGTQTCKPDGTGFGACQGEVVPKPDQCATAEDDDCNGSPMPCVDGWARAYADAAAPVWEGPIAVDVDGNVVFAAWSFESVDYGGGLEPPGDCLVKLDALGSFVWSRCFAGFDRVQSLALDAQRNVLITGYYANAVDFGGGTLPVWDTQQMFVLKLDADGGHVWSRGFGNQLQSTVGRSVAVDPSGSVLVLGFASVTDSSSVFIDFGGGPIELGGCGPVGSGAVVGKLDPAGTFVWAHPISGVKGGTLAADASGNLVVAGQFGNDCPVDFGSGPKMADDPSDGYVLKLDAQGNHIFDQTIGGDSGIFVGSVATSAAGLTVVAGHFNGGAVDFGQGPVSSGAPLAAFVGAVDAAGAWVWSRTAGTSGGTYGYHVLLDPTSDDVLVFGMIDGSADFGGGLLTSVDHDLFVARYDAAGNHLSSEAFAATSEQVAAGLAPMPGGNLAMMCHSQASVDLGVGPAGPGLVVARVPR